MVADGQSPRLPRASREQITGSSCVLSVASVWEVAIKHRLGKLPVSARRFRDEMRSAGAVILSVSDEHALATAELPYAHRDPFDRLLLSVAELEHLVLLTADEALIGLAREHPGLPACPSCPSRVREDGMRQAAGLRSSAAPYRRGKPSKEQAIRDWDRRRSRSSAA